MDFVNDAQWPELFAGKVCEAPVEIDERRMRRLSTVLWGP
ncbi:hypothetical protein FHS85_005298 [Rhodoligotrophos appendicifer]